MNLRSWKFSYPMTRLLHDYNNPFRQGVCTVGDYIRETLQYVVSSSIAKPKKNHSGLASFGERDDLPKIQIKRENHTRLLDRLLKDIAIRQPL